jgi:hypothetical protein
VLAAQTFSLVYRRELRNSDSARAAIGFVRTVIRQNAGLISGVRTSADQVAAGDALTADLAYPVKAGHHKG